MKGKSLKGRLRPHLWYQAYWFVYLIWFFTLDALVQDPKYIIHSPLDDYIPFNEWFVFPYCSWFVLLALVLALLWWNDTPSYDRLCLSMFSGMSLCLILYMLFPNGLQLRPDPATLGRDNPALWLMRLLWAADPSNNVCPSIHCQSTGCMALAMWYSSLAYRHRWVRPVTAVWAAAICASTLFTKQHAVVDVVMGLAMAAVWLPVFRRRWKKLEQNHKNLV